MPQNFYKGKTMLHENIDVKLLTSIDGIALTILKVPCTKPLFWPITIYIDSFKISFKSLEFKWNIIYNSMKY